MGPCVSIQSIYRSGIMTSWQPFRLRKPFCYKCLHASKLFSHFHMHGALASSSETKSKLFTFLTPISINWSYLHVCLIVLSKLHFIGALIGVSFKIPQRLNGQIMAFGAGALLFAVSIEMFAAGKYNWLITIPTKRPWYIWSLPLYACLLACEAKFHFVVPFNNPLLTKPYFFRQGSANWRRVRTLFVWMS